VFYKNAKREVVRKGYMLLYILQFDSCRRPERTALSLNHQSWDIAYGIGLLGRTLVSSGIVDVSGPMAALLPFAQG